MNHDPNCTSCPTCDPDRWQLRTGIAYEESPLQELTMIEDFTPPKPYTRALALRAASERQTPEQVLQAFAERYRADGLRKMMEMRAALDAAVEAHPLPRPTAAELAEFKPPSPYAAGIRALQKKETR